MLIFACVVAHEFGHIFAPRRYGIRTPEVILSPIGDIAIWSACPTSRARSSSVALAGGLR